MSISEVEQHMRILVEQWEEHADQRAIFLRCYLMMTHSMLAAIQAGEFHDQNWVNTLLDRFAGYYFAAQEAYEIEPLNTPPVWRIAFDAALNPRTLALHHLLLGVNAHITYDLVLVLVDMLSSEWKGLSESNHRQRYADHCLVNTIIGRTIDAVQDEIIEPAMPGMDLVDKVMGSIDEWMISRLITHWREQVWQEATRLIELTDAGLQANLVHEIEAQTMRRAEALLGYKGLPGLQEIL